MSNITNEMGLYDQGKEGFDVAELFRPAVAGFVQCTVYALVSSPPNIKCKEPINRAISFICNSLSSIPKKVSFTKTEVFAGLRAPLKTDELEPIVFSKEALHGAAMHGHTEVVELLLGGGVAVDSTNTVGNTPLIFAAINGHAEIVEFLLSKGAAVNRANKHGDTALARASENGHTQIVELLLGKGADVNGENENGYTAFLLSIRNNHEKIRDLLTLAKQRTSPFDGTFTSLQWDLLFKHDPEKPLSLDQEITFKSLHTIYDQYGKEDDSEDYKIYIQLKTVLAKRKAEAELLKAGADWNVKDKFGNTLIHLEQVINKILGSIDAGWPIKFSTQTLRISLGSNILLIALVTALFLKYNEKEHQHIQTSLQMDALREELDRFEELKQTMNQKKTAYEASRLTEAKVKQLNSVKDYVEELIDEDHVFNCPISHTIMIDPVNVGVLGATAEKQAMIQQFDYQIIHKGPGCQLVDPSTTDTLLDDTTLNPNIALKKAIDQFLKEKLTPKQYRIFTLMLDAYHRGGELSVKQAEDKIKTELQQTSAEKIQSAWRRHKG